MRRVYQATAILSASSALSVAVSVLAGKGRAVLLGPGGLGSLVLLQSLVLLIALVGRFGIGPGLVRTAAEAAAAGDEAEVATIRRAAWLLRLVLGIATIAVTLLFWDPISRVFLGGSQSALVVVAVVIALIFSLGYDLELNILAAHQQTAAIAKWSVLNSVLGALASLSVLFLVGIPGIPAAIVLTSLVSWLLAVGFVRRTAPPLSMLPSAGDLRRAGRALLTFGGPYTASQMVGGGVILAIPAMTLAALGGPSVGFYQAAFAVGNNYLGFLANAMSSDYYPRLSAAGSNRNSIAELINQQQRLVYIVALPVILAALLLCPYFVPIIYTAQFQPSVSVLEWMLLGDLFLFSSWSISFAILARSSGLVYFAIELFGGAAHLASAWFGMRWFGLPGLGISWLASNLAYLAVLYAVARRSLGLRWTSQNLRLLVSACTTILVARLAISSGVALIRVPVLLICFVVVTLYSFRALGREFDVGWRQRAILRVRAQFRRGGIAQ